MLSKTWDYNMSIESAGGTSEGTGYDAIEELLAEARDALDQPTALDTMRSMIPEQSAPVDRDEADHMHFLAQEAEYHPMFNSLPRHAVIALMLQEEASRKAAALATPWQQHVSNHGSDLARIARYKEDGLL